MSSAEGAAHKGLQQCIELVMTEVCNWGFYPCFEFLYEFFYPYYVFWVLIICLKCFWRVLLVYSVWTWSLKFLKVERLLSSEQKATEYRSPDDGIIPDHRPTNACTRYETFSCLVLMKGKGYLSHYFSMFHESLCASISVYPLWQNSDGLLIMHFTHFNIRVVAYLSRVLESAFTALEGLNKQAFLTELVWIFSFKQCRFVVSAIVFSLMYMIKWESL